MRAFGVIVLAAGGSSRLGRPKQLLPFRGKALVRHAAETAINTGAAKVLIVVGKEAEEISGQLEGLAAQIVVNPEWQTGIASSIKAGISALEPHIDAVVITTCDQPHVTSVHLRALASAVLAENKQIVASKYEGILGIPCAFSGEQFPNLLSLSGDEGAKTLIRGHRDDIAQIPFEPGALDVDTAEDYRRIAPPGTEPTAT